MKQPDKIFYQLPNANPDKPRAKFKEVNELSVMVDLYEFFGKQFDDGLDRFRLAAGLFFVGTEDGQPIWHGTKEQWQKFNKLV